MYLLYLIIVDFFQKPLQRISIMIFKTCGIIMKLGRGDYIMNINITYI